jgi:hypothetical protein
VAECGCGRMQAVRYANLNQMADLCVDTRRVHISMHACMHAYMQAGRLLVLHTCMVCDKRYSIYIYISSDSIHLHSCLLLSGFHLSGRVVNQIISRYSAFGRLFLKEVYLILIYTRR